MKKQLEKIAKIVVPWIGYVIIHLWFRTCKVRVHGQEYREKVLAEGGNVVATFWHYSMLFILFQVRKDTVSVMVSSSKDGDYLANLATNLGFKPVRGSKNRRGRGALVEMLKDVKSGANAGIVGDGSQGPALKLQMGSVYIASKTGRPIIPIAWSASKYYTFGSWDKTALPKLFSTIDFFYGEPLHVPSGLEGDDLEEYRLIFEKRLQELYATAWEIHGKSEH